MSVDKVPGSNAVAAQASAAGNRSDVPSGVLLNQASLKALADAGWIKGDITSISETGVVRLNTPVGEISIQTSGRGLSTGMAMYLAYDARTGRVAYRPDFSSLAPPEKAPAARQEAMSQGIGQRFSEILAVSSIQPVNAGLVAQSQSVSALNTTIPQSGGLMFPLAVALYPYVLRGGMLADLVRDLEKGYGTSGRLAQMAKTTLVEPVKRPEAEFNFMQWSMPFLSEGEAKTSRWEQSLVPKEDDPAQYMKRTFLEVHFDYTGTVQIDALIDDRQLFVLVTSEKQLDDRLLDQLSGVLEFLCEALGWSYDIDYVFGAEYLAPTPDIQTRDQR